MLPFGAYGPGPSTLPPGTPPPLAAGCMLPEDAAFDPSAELHVPSACAAPADSPLLGCMVLVLDQYPLVPCLQHAWPSTWR